MNRPDAEHWRGEVMDHRDTMVLRRLGEQYAARMDHLEVLIARSNPTVSALVKRMREAGWVRTRHILVGERTWVWLTKAGLQASGLPYREVGPKTVQLAHVGR